MKKVDVRVERICIPTYEIREYDKNPVFLEKRVYQGSSGKVYPHPVCEGVSDEKTDHEYTAVFLENDYILLMVLPELGGRIQRLYDKTNGYDAVYYNEVIKPALVGLAGPWISGGIEFNWPQHHRPSTFDPVDYKVELGSDGSVTVWVGETEKMFHTKGEAGFTVYPDRAYVEITGRVYNPTDRPQTFLWWANPAVAVNEHTRSVFPPDVNAVMDHGKRDVSEFPIAKGVYYKVNYAPGTDISRYKNIPVPTSYMAAHSDFDFIGNYDDSKEAGLLHVADHHISPGKKQWTWGNGDFGRAWDRNLTDANGPYIELMTGVFTDNQPDFTFLKPYEEKSFKQYFMPYRKCGAVKNANTEYALNAEREGNTLKLYIYSMTDHSGMHDRVSVCVAGKEVCSHETVLAPAETQCFEANCDCDDYKVAIVRGEKEILSYEFTVYDAPIPSPAQVMLPPSEIQSNEELYLNGLHLEQYRHATFNPADYYLEGLKRDPGDIRINNAYGRLLYKNGYFKESIQYFEAAIKRSTLRNPNPYDCEPYFNLGLALMKTGQQDKAYDAFYKAAWDGNMQAGAFYKLAVIELGRGNLGHAVSFLESSLARGLHNQKTRTLLACAYRMAQDSESAEKLAGESLEYDALDMGARYERAVLTGCYEEFKELMRDDAGNYLELAFTYMEAGLNSEAEAILKMGPESSPMINYYLYYCTGEKQYLEAGEAAPGLYCFPNNVEDIPVLKRAYADGGIKAAYYLGCLLYDKGNWQEARTLWENIAGNLALPTVYRNLSLVYYNKLKDAAAAKKALKRAFEMDETDVRVFYELVELLRIEGVKDEELLAFMEEHKELLDRHDPLYTEYIALLNRMGAFGEAYKLTSEHKFHPWEGGEGKITGEYKRSLIGMASLEPDDGKACELLTRALSYPYNLGEGRLIGALDNDIYFYLGERTADKGKKEEYYRLAARGEMNLSSAMYYNDQPPEMMFFRALAIARLGDEATARDCFEAMLAYGREHMDDHCSIDYFAVSLPDFLIFETDPDKRNRAHCSSMAALGREGLERISQWK